MLRERYEQVLMWLVVGGLVTCIPVGFGMALYTNNISWLWLCLPLLIFLS